MKPTLNKKQAEEKLNLVNEKLAELDALIADLEAERRELINYLDLNKND